MSEVGNHRWRRCLSGVLSVLAATMVGVTHPLPGERAAGQATAADAPPVADASERTVTVTAAPITVRQAQRTVGAVGSFFGYDEVTVAAEVTGRVARILHDVGDVVQPNDVLLEIDPIDYALALEETLRNLQFDVARIITPLPPDEAFEEERAQAVLRSIDLEQLPTVIRARKTAENAEARFKRAQMLAESKSISDEQYDERSMQREIADSGLAAARLDAQALMAGIRHRLVLLRIARRKLELTHVRVPAPTQRERMPSEVRYAVAARMVSEGEIVKDAPGSSTAVFELVLDGVLKLRAAVPERFAAQVQVGQKAEVRVEAYPDEVFVGDVFRINPMIDRTSRTFEVEIYVENADRRLKAGGFAKVDVLTHVDTEAWTVPVEAVVRYAGSTRIFVMRDGHAHAIPAATGIEGRGWVELIRSASPELRRDDQVITSGQEKLAEGVNVIVRK